MKVYINDSFDGHYPVGSAAVVVAESREEAARLLNEALVKEGLKPEVKEADMEQISKSTARAYIICNGNY